MNIKSLTIYGYGKWIDQRIPIDHKLQVIYGPNEAGKSTIIDFIESMLFGFQNKKQAVHGQYRPRTSKAYGGELRFSEADHNYKLVRTDGPKGGDVKLFDVDHDTELPANTFLEMISPIDRQSYNQLFYFGDFDEKQFYKTDEMSLAIQIQRIGVTDADKWVGLQRALTKTADNLYKPRGRTKLINVKLRKYHELSAKITNAQKAYPEYLDRQAELDRALTNFNSYQAELSAAQQQLDKDRHLMSFLPLVQERAALDQVTTQDLKAAFTDADQAEFNRLNLVIKSTRAQVGENQVKISVLKEEITDSPARKFYESNRQTIERLTAQLPHQRDLAAHIVFLTDQRQANQVKMNDLQLRLPKNASGTVPKPFPNSGVATVNDLLRQEATLFDQLGTKTNSRQTRHRPVVKQSRIGYYVGAGIVAIGTVLLHQLPFSWVGYLLAIGILIWGLNQSDKPAIVPIMPQVDDQELKQQLTTIQSKLATIRSKYALTGIDQSKWIPIQAQLQQLQALQTSEEDIASQLGAEQRQYDQFIDDWRFAQDWVQFDRTNYLENIDELERTITDWQQQVADYQAKQKNLTIYQQLEDQAAKKLEEANQQKTAFLQSRHVKSDDDFIAGINQQKQLREKLRRKNELSQQLKDSKLLIPSEIDKSQLTNKIDHEDKQVSQLQKQLSALSEKKAELKIQIANLVKSGTYFDLRQELANLETDILEDVHRLIALRLADKWIQNVLNIATRGRVPKILKLAKRYFAILTGQRYQDILFENEISVLRNDDVEFAINELSKGTLEQLYLALVFSMAIGFSDQYPLPIMIDDGFVNFDKKRRQAAFEVLKEVSDQTQVLYFTANLEENTNEFDVIDLSQF